jgi:ketosteroid isomerase-like protein
MDKTTTDGALVEKLRKAYAAWHETRGKNVAEWVALMDEHIDMGSCADGAPGMEFSARRKGKAAAHVYFSALEADWEMVHYTVHDIIADGDRVAVFGVCAYRNRKTGKTAETHVANRWRFKDGLAVEYFELYDTAKAFAAAMPDPA